MHVPPETIHSVVRLTDLISMTVLVIRLLSHKNPFFQYNIAITCEVRFNGVTGQGTVPMYSYAKIKKKKNGLLKWRKVYILEPFFFI